MGVSGYQDGQGASVLFYTPWRFAINNAGTFALIVSLLPSDCTTLHLNPMFYVGKVDTYNRVLRRLNISSGVVSTLAGTPQSVGYSDGYGTAAALGRPESVCLDAAGAVALVVSNI